MKIILAVLILLMPVTCFAGFQEGNTQAQPYTKKYISASGTTVVKSGSGVLHTLIVNGGTAGTIIIYNSLLGSGEVMASFDSTNALSTYTFDSGFSSGCTVVTGGATKLTVNFI